MDDGNFFQLDFLLERVRRKTVKEVEEERIAHAAQQQRLPNIDYDDACGDDPPVSPDELQFLPLAPDPAQQEQEWDSEGEEVFAL
jgi:hypothetical protein